MDPETFRRSRAGAGSGAGAAGGRTRGTRGGPGFSYSSGDPGFGSSTGDIDIEDLLGGFFGGRAGRGSRGWGPIPGADQEAELEITLDEAYHGTRRSLSLSGDGARATLDVNVPPGVTDGQRIRLAGQGGRGGDGGANGDLYLVVRIAPHPRYRISGRDLSVDLPLAPWEAALGTTVAVDTPGGEAKVKIPAGTSSGRRLRLRGRGLPNPRGKPGDLFAETKIMVPPRPSKAERRLFEQLAAESDFDPRRQT
jgi:curved DNA-binding protein